jgi:hypothetical protein
MMGIIMVVYFRKQCSVYLYLHIHTHFKPTCIFYCRKLLRHDGSDEIDILDVYIYIIDINKLIVDTENHFLLVFGIAKWESNGTESVCHSNEFKHKNRRIFNDNQRVHSYGI